MEGGVEEMSSGSRSIMTDDEFKFVREFCIDFNFEGACDRLGLSEKQGMRLLRLERVKSAIAERRAELVKSDVVNVGFVITALKENALVSMGKVPLITNSGENMGYQEYNPSAANRALELLGKSIGMFRDDSKMDVQVNIANALVSQWEKENNAEEV